MLLTCLFPGALALRRLHANRRPLVAEKEVVQSGKMVKRALRGSGISPVFIHAFFLSRLVV